MINIKVIVREPVRRIFTRDETSIFLNIPASIRLEVNFSETKNVYTPIKRDMRRVIAYRL